VGEKIVPGSKNPTDQVITTMLKQKESFFRKYFCGCFPRDQPMKAKTDWGSFGDKAPEKAPADQKQCDFGRKQSNAGERQPDWGLFGEKLHRKHLLVINNRILEKNPTGVLFGKKSGKRIN